MLVNNHNKFSNHYQIQAKSNLFYLIRNNPNEDSMLSANQKLQKLT